VEVITKVKKLNSSIPNVYENEEENSLFVSHNFNQIQKHL